MPTPSRYRRRVGVLLMPGRTAGSATSITQDNVDWFADRGVEVIPIPHDTSAIDYYINHVDGLYFQGGGTSDAAYYATCAKLIAAAIAANNAGRYFPVWGTCHGFLALMIIVGRLSLPLPEVDAHNSYRAETAWTKAAPRSRLYHALAPEFRRHVTTPRAVFFNNEHGISPATFAANRRLATFFKPLATATDRRGRRFIAVIEARRYPFFGVQFHPERSPTMSPFCEFFVDQLMRTRGRRPPIDTRHRLLGTRRRRAPYATKRFNELYTRKACRGHWSRLFPPAGCYYFKE